MRRVKYFLGVLLLGAILLIGGAILSQLDSVVELIIAFYTKFSWNAVASLLLTGFIPGIVLGRAIGPRKKKEE